MKERDNSSVRDRFQAFRDRYFSNEGQALEKRNKPTVSQRVNARFYEPEGYTFKDGKWRWWLITVVALEVVAAILTVKLLGGDSLFAWVVAGVISAILMWLSVCFMYYTDSGDPKLDKWVSALDSVLLVLSVIHLGFLIWVWGHVGNLRAQEARYETERVEYNRQVKEQTAAQVKLAEVQKETAQIDLKRSALDADAAYWSARRGGSAQSAAPRGGGGVNASLPPLARPKEIEGETSFAFVGKWDSWVRIASVAYILCAVFNLIVIRNRSVRANAAARGALTLNAGAVLAGPRVATQAPFRQQISTQPSSVATQPVDAFQMLKDHLNAIAPGFKAEVKRNGVRIRLYRSQNQQEILVKSTSQPLSILDAVVNRPNRFREVLIDTLRREGFPI
jgi:hypothetical protein